MSKFKFTYQELGVQLEKAKSNDYDFIRCVDYYNAKVKSIELKKNTVVFRVDIDFSLAKTSHLLDLFRELGIKASFYLRLHAPEYNPFSFENYLIVKRIINEGHELGYHSEVVDQAAIWSENEVDCLKRDIEVIKSMFGHDIEGIASHGGMTGLNNLDFWKDREAQDFKLKYEAYENTSSFDLFSQSFYVSDSEWTRWKCYNKGELVNNDNRTFGDHLDDKHSLIYLLIHPDTYYKRHFYEH